MNAYFRPRRLGQAKLEMVLGTNCSATPPWRLWQPAPLWIKLCFMCVFSSTCSHHYSPKAILHRTMARQVTFDQSASRALTVDSQLRDCGDLRIHFFPMVLWMPPPPPRVTGIFVRGIRRWPVNPSHKWPVTRKMLPFNDVIVNN